MALFTVHTGQSLGFSDSLVGKVSARNSGDSGLIPGLGRSPVEGKGYPLQYSGLENSMDCIVHGVAKSQTRLSDFHSLTGQSPPRTVTGIRISAFSELLLSGQLACLSVLSADWPYNNAQETRSGCMK